MLGASSTGWNVDQADTHVHVCVQEREKLYYNNDDNMTERDFSTQHVMGEGGNKHRIRGPKLKGLCFRLQKETSLDQ